jgi:hypothetical protein
MFSVRYMYRPTGASPFDLQPKRTWAKQVATALSAHPSIFGQQRIQDLIRSLQLGVYNLNAV